MPALQVVSDLCVDTAVDDFDYSSAGLLFRKNRGGLLMPSADVILICKLCEKAFRTLFYENNCKPPSGVKPKMKLVSLVLSRLTKVNVFSCLFQHSLETDPLNDHRVRLMKMVCNQYFSVRFYHAGKVYTRTLQGDRVRSLLTKTIIFKGQ
jgi:hypothetical protein